MNRTTTTTTTTPSPTQALKITWIIASLVTSWPSLSWGCPVCNSATGDQVRAGIFNRDFLAYLGITALPFAIFAVIGFVLFYGWPWQHPIHKSEI